MKFDELRKIDVSKYVEQKNGLSYLSWAWAVDQLLLHDPKASWTYKCDADGVPMVRVGDTAMVFCTVNAFGVERTAQLPVMNAKNQPITFSGRKFTDRNGREQIEQLDSFNLNTAMQRCLAKAVALHGIGLYIYNGEDLPPDTKPEDRVPAERREELAGLITAAGDDVALRKLFKGLTEDERAAMHDAFVTRAAAIKEAA